MGRGSSGTGLVADIYSRLDVAYGAEHWHWMPEHASPIEIVVGAILVQHTTWLSAERALNAMRAAGLLTVEAILDAPEDSLIEATRVSGTPTVKAGRLCAIAHTIIEAGGLDALLALPLDDLRRRLLATYGIGPETADAIALYAAGKRVFVIDAYTRRVFRRIGIRPERDRYEDWRAFFEDAMRGADAHLFQRFHAWIVLHAKAICRQRPLCGACPLLEVCDTGRMTLTPPADVRPPTTARAAQTAR